MSDLPKPDFLGVHEAARYVRVRPQTLARLIRRRRVPVQLRQGRYVVRRADLDSRFRSDKSAE